MKTFLSPLVVVALAVMLYASSVERDREPEHAGKALSEWLMDLDSMDHPTFRRAEGAIVEMGTNCLPGLQRRLRAHDSSILTGLAELAGLFGLPTPPPAETFHSPALQACRVLGPAASPLTPDIAAFLDGSRQAEAVKVLVAIGPAAIPVLVPVGSGTNPSSRAGAAAALGTLAMEAEAVVPLLETLLLDSDDQVRVVAAWALERYGARAVSTLPKLAALADSPVSEGPLLARSVRGRIAADTSSSAGRPQIGMPPR